jgi:integrase
VAGSTLAKAVTELRRAFEERCRSGPWDFPPGASSPRGNPTNSIRVTDYVRAYQKYCHLVGIQERSAIPLPYEKYLALLRGVGEEITEELQKVVARTGREYTLLLLLRDAAAFSLMWHSSRRGADVLSVQWGGIYDGATDLPVWSRWLDGASPWLPEKIYVVPYKTKSEQVGRPATQVVKAWEEDWDCCAIQCLSYYCRALVQAGHVVSASDYVFTGLTRRNPGPIAADALQLRLKRALGVHAVRPRGSADRGFTLHSFRRGRLQHEFYENKMRVEDLQQLAGIKELGVLQRYLDEGRHLG